MQRSYIPIRGYRDETKSPGRDVISGLMAILNKEQRLAYFFQNTAKHNIG